MPSGSLTVIGTGIEIGGHLTPQARDAFRRADEALYLVGDPVTMSFLERLRPGARSLHAHYRPDAPRTEAYEAMVEEMLAGARSGRTVCAAFYGHPGVFVFPAREAVDRARREGFAARLLPGISSIDCLFADLGLDPALNGCQIYHATDFVLHRTRPDTSAALILLQISVIGQAGHRPQGDWSRLPVLIDYLTEFYEPEHEVVAYEASPYAIAGPVVERVRLTDLASARLTSAMTLLVPPSSSHAADPTMLARLGLDPR